MVNGGYKWLYRPTETDRHGPKLNQTQRPETTLHSHTSHQAPMGPGWPGEAAWAAGWAESR